MEAKQNTLAQAEVRRNRLKNNTTRLSSAPDQAICNCWHKRTLAGYLRRVSNRADCLIHFWLLERVVLMSAVEWQAAERTTEKSS